MLTRLGPLPIRFPPPATKLGPTRCAATRSTVLNTVSAMIATKSIAIVFFITYHLLCRLSDAKGRFLSEKDCTSHPYKAFVEHFFDTLSDVRRAQLQMIFDAPVSQRLPGNKALHRASEFQETIHTAVRYSTRPRALKLHAT